MPKKAPKPGDYVVYRIFPWDGKNVKSVFPQLFPPKHLQGYGRHDIRGIDNVIYCSLSKVSAIAETWKDFYNRELSKQDLLNTLHLQDERVKVLTKLHIRGGNILDLTESKLLAEHHIRPMDMATHDRVTTQKISRMVYEKGFDGFLWWSSIESKWINMSCFESRIQKKLGRLTEYSRLNLEDPAAIEALKTLKIKVIPFQ